MAYRAVADRRYPDYIDLDPARPDHPNSDIMALSCDNVKIDTV
jgi:hypothetical protein